MSLEDPWSIDFEKSQNTYTLTSSSAHAPTSDGASAKTFSLVEDFGLNRV